MGDALAGRRRWLWGVAVIVLALIGYEVVHALNAVPPRSPRRLPPRRSTAVT
jgi:hypothetical protein